MKIKICRKRPTFVDAMMFIDTPECIYELSIFSEQELEVDRRNPKNPTITLDTLVGKRVAKVGDYIVRENGKGCHPCKRRLFEKLYETIGEEYVPNTTI